MSSISVKEIREQMEEIIDEWISLNVLKSGQIFVIGCATSEVAGERIGTSGNEQIAQTIFDSLNPLQEKTGVLLAFQCCEHLNRALVVEEETAAKYNLTEVSAIPIPGAGGSMAAYAYQNCKSPVLVESIQAHAGIDIGDTFIGMHLKSVAVPIRLKRKNIGAAHLTAARTRPKLIGGVRAVYTQESKTNTKSCD